MKSLIIILTLAIITVVGGVIYMDWAINQDIKEHREATCDELEYMGEYSVERCK